MTEKFYPYRCIFGLLTESRTYLQPTRHAILVHITRVNLEDYGIKVGLVRYSPVNLGGRSQYKKWVQYDFKFTSIYSDDKLILKPRESIFIFSIERRCVTWSIYSKIVSLQDIQEYIIKTYIFNILENAYFTIGLRFKIISA